MENRDGLNPQNKRLTIGGKEISVVVEPRIVNFGETQKIIYKPSITTTHPLKLVEDLVGKNQMQHQGVASYSRRDTESDVLQAVIEKKGDLGLVCMLPESLLEDDPTLTVLATIDNTGSLPNCVLHLIGRREAPHSQALI